MGPVWEVWVSDRGSALSCCVGLEQWLPLSVLEFSQLLPVSHSLAL